MVRKFEHLTGESLALHPSPYTHCNCLAEQVDHFLEHGYIVIKNAFSRQQATGFTSELWTRLGLDPDDKSTWTREKIHMPWLKRVKVADFSPKVYFLSSTLIIWLIAVNLLGVGSYNRASWRRRAYRYRCCDMGGLLYRQSGNRGICATAAICSSPGPD